MIKNVEWVSQFYENNNDKINWLEKLVNGSSGSCANNIGNSNSNGCNY